MADSTRHPACTPPSMANPEVRSADEAAAQSMRVAMTALAGLVAKHGGILPLSDTVCCDVVWSSDPRVLDVVNGGWTRTGRCGKCDRLLIACR
jgi:hypothetical protein